MLSNDERRYLAELGREQDRVLFEHEQWTARREAEREASVRKSEPEAPSVGPTIENAPAPANGSGGEPSEDEAYPPLQQLLKSMSEFTSEYVSQRLAEYDLRVRGESTDRIAALQIEVDQLLGRLSALRRDFVKLARGAASDRVEMRRERALLYDEIKMLRKRLDLNERDNVVDLPDWRKRHGAA
jgi:hypothetical protein